MSEMNETHANETARVGRFRYVIGGTFFCMVLVNYLDRVNLSTAGPAMMKELHLSESTFGILASAFTWTYLVFQLPAGLLLDRMGVKWLVRVGSFLWAIPTLLTAVLSGLGPLILVRVFLGLTEGPIVPAASKATGYWFPFRERGFATSLFESGSKVSNVIGVPLCALVISEWGWRWAFVWTAGISLVFAIWFWIIYRDPEDQPRLSKAELEYIQDNGAQSVGLPVPGEGLGFLLRQRKVWGLAIGCFAYNYAIFVFLTWLPDYFVHATGMKILKSGLFTAIPWTFGSLGDLLIGGLLVDILIRRGFDSSRVRKWMIVIGLLMGVAVVGAGSTHSPAVAITWISVAVMGVCITAPVFWAIPSIIAPIGRVGTVSGIMNMTGMIAALVSPIVTGFILTATGSFALDFLIIAVVLLVGIYAILGPLGQIEQIPAPARDGSASTSDPRLPA
ncbi:MFS transporter [Tsukamurella soli]|uniref:MFS transporter n=1 Tax=Tsukamurella soli TaxID=644556 RepID=A0ABP8JUR5_9ACTN